MKMNAKLGVILFVLAVGVGALAVPMPDSTKQVDASPRKAKPSTPDLIFNRKLSSTSFSSGTDVQLLSPGKVSIDSPLSFVCPRGGCTITAELHVQMGFNTTPENLLGLCVELDGTDMPPGCPNVASVPTDETFVGASWIFAQSGVTAGSHTIQGFVDTTYGATRAYYIITYRLYTP